MMDSTVIFIFRPKDLVSKLWGPWFSQKHRIEIARNQIMMRDEKLKAKWVADNRKMMERWEEEENESG